MKDILRALRECGKKEVEDRSKALNDGNYPEVMRSDERIGLLRIATDRCEVLMEVLEWPAQSVTSRTCAKCFYSKDCGIAITYARSGHNYDMPIFRRNP